MKSNIKVSIIMPIFNTERYLKQSLHSVLNQSLKEIEIICVNDGSTDCSLEILREYQKRDSRLKIIDKKNSGYGDSMNVGIENACGEYIGIVEPDDFVKQNMFKSLYKIAKRKDVDIVKSNHIEFDENKEKFIQVCPNIAMYNKKLNRKDNQIFKAVMNTWSGIYRKSFLKKNEILHNTTPGASFQDTGFWFQTMAMAESVCFVNKTFYYHRMDNPNSSINNPNKVYCVCDEFEFIKKELEEKGLFSELKQVYLMEKYKHYIYSFFRINSHYKEKFLQDVIKEFLEVDKEFAKKYFNKVKYQRFLEFIEDKESFYNKYSDQNYPQYINEIENSLEKNNLKRLIFKIKRYGIKNILIMFIKYKKEKK